MSAITEAAVEAAMEAWILSVAGLNGIEVEEKWDANLSREDRRQMLIAMRAALAAAVPHFAAPDWRPPDGWRLVPEGPTAAMISAGAWVTRLNRRFENADATGEVIGPEDAERVFAAMLAAAPLPPGSAI